MSAPKNSKKREYSGNSNKAIKKINSKQTNGNDEGKTKSIGIIKKTTSLNLEKNTRKSFNTDRKNARKSKNPKKTSVRTGKNSKANDKLY